MTIAAMEKLRECGWYLTEHGFDLVSDYGSIVEPQKMIKRAIEFDLKEISTGEGDISQGNVVLQIQKQRNVAAPKNNEESRGAPRMLKISFTDGKNSYQAIELEPISTISLNTPPGTKILIRGGSLVMSHGIILLRPQNIVQCLGGKVANLVEKWEINKKLASHSRVRPVEEGGPPPWIPFGKKIVKIAEQGKFKALAEKEKEKEENVEFEAQRKNAIAEAAKQGSKKVFGGGNKQLLDHSVQKIVDNGFTIEQAEYALKVSRNNVDKALKSLQRYDNKSSNSVREPREPREPKGKRGDKKNEEVSSKPSSGKISLFDFLEDKLPAQVENLDINNSQYDKHGKDRSDSYSDRHSKSNDHQQSGRGGGRNAHGRGYQIPPRHLENNRPNKFNSTSTTSAHGGTYNPTPPKSNKPPRFQRNQETQNFHSQVYQQQQQHHQEPIGSYNKFPQINEFHSMPPFSQSRQGASTPREYSSNMSQKNHPDYQSKNQQSYQTQVIQNSRNQNYGNNAQTYQSSTNASDRNFGDNQSNQFYKTANDNYDYNSMLGGVNISQKSSSYYNSNFNNEEPLGGTWVWRVGDRCMAKYWEDNMYYNAEVTAVSKTTCVVLFKDFHNYEEVLQIDCIPITEENPNTQNQNAGGFDNNRRVDQQYRSNNRPPRFEQNQNNSNTSEYRRGGGGSNKNNRRRNQQRSAQPIYQPPAQRGNVGAGNFSDT